MCVCVYIAWITTVCLCLNIKTASFMKTHKIDTS